MRYQGNWDEFIKGRNGQPLMLFHGTNRDFTHFELTETVDVGIHFGCPVQADYFSVGKQGGRIIPAYIRSMSSIDVGNRDFGWKWPHQTIRSLENTLRGGEFLFTGEDVELLGFPRGMSLVQAHKKDCEFADSTADAQALEQKCRTVNRKIEKALRGKGVDCIVYTNRHEPNDGVARDAYLVLDPKQIVSAIDHEILGG